jgi:hypothetical protein
MCQLELTIRPQIWPKINNFPAHLTIYKTDKVVLFVKKTPGGLGRNSAECHGSMMALATIERIPPSST